MELKHLLEKLSQSKGIFRDFSQTYRNHYKINGKTAKEWDDHFRIELDQDLNPASCRAVLVKIFNLYQEASFYKTNAEAQQAALENSFEGNYNERLIGLTAQYKEAKDSQRPPTKDVISAEVEHSLSDLKAAGVHATIELSFWKEILSRLAMLRKIIENAGISLAIEAKLMPHTGTDE